MAVRCESISRYDNDVDSKGDESGGHIQVGRKNNANKGETLIVKSCLADM